MQYHSVQYSTFSEIGVYVILIFMLKFLCFNLLLFQLKKLPTMQSYHICINLKILLTLTNFLQNVVYLLVTPACYWDAFGDIHKSSNFLGQTTGIENTIRYIYTMVSLPEHVPHWPAEFTSHVLCRFDGF